MQKMIEEIGKDPKAVDKYRDNKELMKFYQTCSSLLPLSPPAVRCAFDSCASADIRLMSSFAQKSQKPK